MKKLLFPLFVITFFSCDQQKSIKSSGKKQNSSRYESLFRQFINIGIDTLEVYSTEDLADNMSGRAIDSINALFFPEDMAQWHINYPPGLFAIYKFAIDKNRLGLLVRTPSEYVPSSVKLFFFDIVKDSLTSYIELAESWGDAGDYMVKNSWLFRDSSKHLQVLINTTHGYDHSAENRNDTTVDESDYYALLDLSKPRIDTIFQQKEVLPEKYKVLVKKRTRN